MSTFKKLGFAGVSILLFLLDMLYASLIFSTLNLFGINVDSFPDSLKYFCVSLIYITFMLILFLIYHKDIISDFKEYKSNFKKYFVFGLKCWAIGLTLMGASNIVLGVVLPSSGPENEAILQEAMKSYPLYIFFSSVIYAPFVEELVFRKSVRKIFDNKLVYIIVSGLAFGFAHTIAGLSNPYEIFYIIPYGLMGCVFAYIYAKTDNILISMNFHLIHNFIAVVMSLLMYLGGI